jgi:HEPN domain-containing protein
MTAGDQVSYRLRLAQGFLDEARQDVDLKRWRSAMDNAQLSVENATKAVLALLGPVGRTHNPAEQLRQVLSQSVFSGDNLARVQQLAEQAELLGPDVHIQTDYGDEPGGRTPWELFSETDARQALATAERAFQLAQSVVQEAQSQAQNPEQSSNGEPKKP